MGDLGEGQARAILGHVSVGGREDEFVAQRPQEAGVVHGADREGDRLLGGLLRRGDHREEAHPRRLDTLPLGWSAISPTMSPIDGSSKAESVPLMTLGPRSMQSSVCQVPRKTLPRTPVHREPGARIPAPGKTTNVFFLLLGAGGGRGSALRRSHLIWRHLVYAVLHQGV